MNIQELRELIADEFEQYKPEGWDITTDTRPTLYSGLIAVGHVTDITFKSYGTVDLFLYVTLWVDEAVDTEAAIKLYELVTPGPNSIIWKWWQTSRAGASGPPVVERVGDYVESQSRFLAAAIKIPFQITTG